MPAPQQTGLIRLGMRRLGQQITGGGPGSGIQEITSDDGTVTITNPTGPITDLSVPAASGGGWDLDLSYGDGVGDIANQLPTAEGETEFWIGQRTDADSAGVVGALAQKREWATHEWLQSLRLVSFIDEADLVGAAVTGRLQVTVNGADTGIGIDIAAGVTTDSYETDAADILVSPGQRIGLKFVTTGLEEGSTLRGHWRIIGGVTAAPTGPYVSPLLTAAYESFSDGGFPIVTDDDGVLTQPNRTGVTAFDRVFVAGGGATQAQLLPDGLGTGIPSISGSALLAPTLKFAAPTTGFWSAPVGPIFAPMTMYWIGRLNAGGGAAQANCIVVKMPSGGPTLGLIIHQPIGASFQLVSQWNATDNVQTVANLTGAILGELVMFTIGIDAAGAMFFRLNNLDVPLTTTDPAPTGPGACSDLQFSNAVDAVDKDEGALYFYDGELTDAQNAQNVDYFNTRFNLGL